MQKFPFEDLIEKQVQTSTSATLDGDPVAVKGLFAATTAGITGIADDLMAAIPSPQPIACRAGCSHCCNSREIHVAPIEATAVFQAIGALSNEYQQRIRDVAHGQSGQKDQDHAAERPLAQLPCPLLEDGVCLIYEQRPMVCRGFNSFDAVVCERKKNGDATAEIKGHAVPDAVWQAALRGLQRGSVDLGRSGDLLDLTRALEIMFENPDAIADWATGGKILDGAKSRMA